MSACDTVERRSFHQASRLWGRERQLGDRATVWETLAAFPTRLHSPLESLNPLLEPIHPTFYPSPRNEHKLHWFDAGVHALALQVCIGSSTEYTQGRSRNSSLSDPFLVTMYTWHWVFGRMLDYINHHLFNSTVEGGGGEYARVRDCTPSETMTSAEIFCSRSKRLFLRYILQNSTLLQILLGYSKSL